MTESLRTLLMVHLSLMTMSLRTVSLLMRVRAMCWSAISSVMTEVIIKIKLLMSPATVATVVGVCSDAESVVTVVTTVSILLTELSVTMRAVLVSIGIAILVMSRSPWAIRVVVMAAVMSELRTFVKTSEIVIQIKLLVSTTTVATTMGWVTVSTATSVTVSTTSVVSVMDTDAESVVTVIASVEVLFTEFSVVMRTVRVSLGVAILVMFRSSGTI